MNNKTNEAIYQEILETVMTELFDDALTRADKPEKLHGEAESIYAFGYAMFKYGFMQGMGSGVQLAKCGDDE